MLATGSKKRIILGMSGGVDSSVAALLLRDQGYIVKGVALKLWAYNAENPCCSTKDLNDAQMIAKHLGIEFEILDVQEAFKRSVVDYYIKELSEGRTPNPCIVCNDYLKFGLLLNYALENNYDFVATGHYARIQINETGYHLMKSFDQEKDQSYFLFMLDQKRLPNILFPLGELTKEKVRGIARHAELITCGKKDSQELCFLPEGGSEEFYRTYTNFAPQAGMIIDSKGEVVGTHKGLQFYTIGQRRGIGAFTNKPVYVVNKNIKDNSLTIGTHEDLMASILTVKDVHWIISPPAFPMYANVRIRYRHKEKKALITNENDVITIKFDSPQRAITPGQAAVFYNGDEVLGGGWIWEVKE
ncbi:MAG: tRNA 2-thiouridine(34) synthase MnmA [bacterium]